MVCVEGFKANGIKEGKNGLGIIFSEVKANVGMLFTRNRIKAAPLIVSKRHAKIGYTRAVVVNSGNANAYTGIEGIRDAEEMCKITSEELGIKKEEVLVASTGVIARKLDIELILRQIKSVAKKLECSDSASMNFARAIMTTDTKPKLFKKTVEIDGKEIEIGVAAKGSGMIAPNMGTMLCFITTNARIDMPKRILKSVVDETLNMVVVDGDTSTNDFVVLLANGLAENRKIDGFKRALYEVLDEAAKAIAKDGEGATKLIVCRVVNARNKRDAKRIAKSVISSNLVKTAFFGNDPNFGRIIAAVGYSNAYIKPEKISLYISSAKGKAVLVEEGRIRDNIEFAREIMKEDEVEITIDLGLGRACAKAYGCDMSYDYIRINAEYTT